MFIDINSTLKNTFGHVTPPDSVLLKYRRKSYYVGHLGKVIIVLNNIRPPLLQVTILKHDVISQKLISTEYYRRIYIKRDQTSYLSVEEMHKGIFSIQVSFCTQ